MADAELHIERENGRIRIRGVLELRNFRQAKESLRQAAGDYTIIDMSQVTRLDTSGVLLLSNKFQLERLRPEHQALFNLVAQTEPGKPSAKKRLPDWKRMIVRLGKAAANIWPATAEFIVFMGRACAALASAMKHPARLRFISITHHIEAIGIDAIPIIGLIAFVISIVIAYQGQVQLRSLGAELYTVNLIAISVLREMGVLLTAIMIAGRSGSAFTAEIGAMKVRQELDALRSIGFDTFDLLVLPRLIALLIVLPLLTLFANIMGLLGGALISLSLLDIAMPEYLERARQAVTWKDLFVGLVKAPVFALVIALVGCMHGLKVSGSAESVGKETTASVVKSIFLVLMLDGLFSIYFEKVGL